MGRRLPDNEPGLPQTGQITEANEFFSRSTFIGLSFTPDNRDFPDFGAGDYLIFFHWIYRRSG